MKKKIIIALAILACLTVAVGGTLAWFTAYGTARNVITTGGIDVEVVEHQMVDGEPVPYPPEPIQIVPATSVSKVVSAKSLDAPACHHCAGRQRQGEGHPRRQRCQGCHRPHKQHQLDREGRLVVLQGRAFCR